MEKLLNIKIDKNRENNLQAPKKLSLINTKSPWRKLDIVDIESKIIIIFLVDLIVDARY